jgi:hypothetical protein
MSATLPRADIPIAANAQISGEWYRWARDITLSLGGTTGAASVSELQLTPPSYPAETPTLVDPLLQDQDPPRLPVEDRPDEYRPAVVPAEDAIAPSSYAPPVLPVAEDAIAPSSYAPPTVVLESTEWLNPPVPANIERIEWLESRILQLQAIIEELATRVAGMQQGNLML